MKSLVFALLSLLLVSCASSKGPIGPAATKHLITIDVQRDSAGKHFITATPNMLDFPKVPDAVRIKDKSGAVIEWVMTPSSSADSFSVQFAYGSISNDCKKKKKERPCRNVNEIEFDDGLPLSRLKDLPPSEIRIDGAHFAKYDIVAFDSAGAQIARLDPWVVIEK